MYITLSPVADQRRGREDLLHVGVLDHGAVVAVGDAGDGGEAGVVVDDKDHPIRIIFVTDHFIQGFLSWYLSGLFYTGINNFGLVISC